MRGRRSAKPVAGQGLPRREEEEDAGAVEKGGQREGDGTTVLELPPTMTEEEVLHVLRVVERDASLRRRETRRIRTLRQDVEEEETKGSLLSRQERFSGKRCVRCCAAFCCLLNARRRCQACRRFVCARCCCSRRWCCERAERGWRCRTCCKATRVESLALRWFYDGARARFGGCGGAEVACVVRARLRPAWEGGSHLADSLMAEVSAAAWRAASDAVREVVSSRAERRGRRSAGTLAAGDGPTTPSLARQKGGVEEERQLDILRGSGAVLVSELTASITSKLLNGDASFPGHGGVLHMPSNDGGDGDPITSPDTDSPRRSAPARRRDRASIAPTHTSELLPGPATSAHTCGNVENAGNVENVGSDGNAGGVGRPVTAAGNDANGEDVPRCSDTPGEETDEPRGPGGVGVCRDASRSSSTADGPPADPSISPGATVDPSPAVPPPDAGPSPVAAAGGETIGVRDSSYEQPASVGRRAGGDPGEESPWGHRSGDYSVDDDAVRATLGLGHRGRSRRPRADAGPTGAERLPRASDGPGESLVPEGGGESRSPERGREGRGSPAGCDAGEAAGVGDGPPTAAERGPRRTLHEGPARVLGEGSAAEGADGAEGSPGCLDQRGVRSVSSPELGQRHGDAPRPLRRGTVLRHGQRQERMSTGILAEEEEAENEEEEDQGKDETAADSDSTTIATDEGDAEEEVEVEMRKRYTAASLRSLTTHALRLIADAQRLLSRPGAGDGGPAPSRRVARALDQRLSELEENVYVGAGQAFELEEELRHLEEGARGIHAATTERELAWLEDRVATASAQVQGAEGQISDIEQSVSCLGVRLPAGPVTRREPQAALMESPKPRSRKLPAPPGSESYVQADWMRELSGEPSEFA
uniref:Uncharacterized protein LOC116940922 isoform X2 n=1 Tax=Petromyzon marinus TaxID=7757 RepID=A0AAJ7SZ01_PETMA|nr:uncharacterized protein LOC116940922 isoform X2 [Petromyzon marinus]